MNISEKNLFAIYYKWIYGKLPYDLCSFFWGTLFAVLLAPFYVVGRLVNLEGSARFWPGVLAWFVYFVLLFIGVNLLQGWYGVKKGEEIEFCLSLSWYTVWIIAPILGSLLIVLVFGFIGLVAYCVETIKDRRESRIPRSSNTKDFIGAIRRKYCVKIKWY